MILSQKKRLANSGTNRPSLEPRSILQPFRTSVPHSYVLRQNMSRCIVVCKNYLTYKYTYIHIYIYNFQYICVHDLRIYIYIYTLFTLYLWTRGEQRPLRRSGMQRVRRKCVTMSKNTMPNMTRTRVFLDRTRGKLNILQITERLQPATRESTWPSGANAGKWGRKSRHTTRARRNWKGEHLPALRASVSERTTKSFCIV